MVLIFILLAQIILAALVGNDAHMRGYNPDVWILVVALTGIFGIVGYLVIRRPSYVEDSRRKSSEIKTFAKTLLIYGPLLYIGFLIGSVSHIAVMVVPPLAVAYYRNKERVNRMVRRIHPS